MPRVTIIERPLGEIAPLKMTASVKWVVGVSAGAPKR
jgi:hypothetical protein